jgi:chemotaxis protein MotB
MPELTMPAKGRKNTPAWVMTFADLMTLLMCFFVLLLSFSEMDAAKFKQLSGSMKEAFGVQAEIKARTIPKGTSIIAREFSPGKPDPTAMNSIRQFTIDSSKNSLDALSEEMKEVEKARKHAQRIRTALDSEIRKNSISVQVKGSTVIIYVREKASFLSGDADVRAAFVPVLHKIAGLIGSEDGTVTVAGHTDDIPIATARYRSNWELSTSRAVSVAHELLGAAALDQSRFVVSGYADTRPQTDNDTAEHRASNRRVEISISRVAKKDIRQDTASSEIMASSNPGNPNNE